MDVVSRLSDSIDRLLRRQDRVLVGVDGPDAAGKTTLAGRLATRLTAPVITASIDSFHQQRTVRRQWGDLSPEGYYLDSFDYPALVDRLLVPFSAGAPVVLTSAFDHRADREREVVATGVPARAVLVFDGVFLLRAPVRRFWTLAVYLHVPPEETVRRGLVRDLDVFGSPAEVARRYETRYAPGQALYRKEANPETTADVVIDNTDIEAPSIRRWNLPGIT